MATSAFQKPAKSQQGVLYPAKAGGLAGLGGGLVFGLMMGMMGMLPMIANMAGSSSAVLGFILHMGISAFIGTTYGIVASRLPSWTTVHFNAGVANGIAWWVLGALILMPLMLGMSEMIFAIGPPQVLSLVGHLIYGLVTARLFFWLYWRS